MQVVALRYFFDQEICPERLAGSACIISNHVYRPITGNALRDDRECGGAVSIKEITQDHLRLGFAESAFCAG